MHEIALQNGNGILKPTATAENRTEEVADIIEQMPTGFGIWVSAIVVFIAALLFVFGYFIKYPDVLRGQITISSTQAPVKLIASTAGRIELLQHQSGQTMNADEYVAVVKNPANTSDILLVKDLLNKINIHQVSYEAHRTFFPVNVSLGEVNNKYFAFLNALYQYLDYYCEKPYDQQKDILQKLSVSQQTALTQSMEDYARLKTKYQLALSFYKREAGLFDQKVIAAAELEQAHISLITTEQEYKAADKEINSSNYQLQDANNKLQLLVFQRMDKDRELEINLLNSYYEIQESIRQWERSYVFIAPIKGKVEFLSFLKNDDYIQVGQEMFSIVPAQNQMYGQVLLPEQGAGKVKAGQIVVIKLDGYPYAQYGSVKGKVSNISKVTNQQTLSTSQNKINAYLVTVDLPNGLLTNYKATLPFWFDAKGTAEIITSDRRLMERLFDNLKHSVK